MKIAKIIIPEYRQFKNFELDLTYPEGHAKAGLPLEKVCFIGRNGTGKSTLLDIIRNRFSEKEDNIQFILKKISAKNINYYDLTFSYLKPRFGWFGNYTINERVENEINWLDNIANFIKQEDIQIDKEPNEKNPMRPFLYTVGEQKELGLLDEWEKTLRIHSPAESDKNLLVSLKDVPETNVNNALLYLKNKQNYYTVSNDTIVSFWTILIANIKERESFWHEFSDLPENQDKTQRELKEIFDPTHPKILEELAKLWDSILNKCGLYFDYKSAKNPIQLLDNLQVYIKTTSQNEIIGYSGLSTGIRNFIFRLGHIFSLYFNREVESGFLLVDEPENSLFPDFKRDLIEIYLDIIKGKNTQFFVATHDPIIAAQFEPCERVILDFDENGFVTTESCHKGVMGEGDDPNDILQEDFGMRVLYGKVGLQKWQRFLELKNLMKHTEDKIEKAKLMEEFLEIAKNYKFSVK